MKRFLPLVLALLAFALALAELLLYLHLPAARTNDAEDGAALLKNSLSQIEELATADYHYTRMASFKDAKELYGVKIPFTTKTFLLSYDGRIKSGVDLSQAKLSVKEGKIHLTLPPARILSHEIDEKSIRVYDESASIFNPIEVKDMSAFTHDQKAKAEAEAKAKGLLEDADAKAREALEAWFKALPESAHYELVID